MFAGPRRLRRDPKRMLGWLRPQGAVQQRELNDVQESANQYKTFASVQRFRWRPGGGDLQPHRRKANRNKFRSQRTRGRGGPGVTSWRLYRHTDKQRGGVPAATGEAARTLAEIEDDAGFDKLDTRALETDLAGAIEKLSRAADVDQRRTFSVDALTAARRLAARIGDNSNLTLDPDLDSYYVQDIVVAKIPILLSQIGELHSQLETPSPGNSSAADPAVAALVLGGMIRSTLDGIESDLQASYRGGRGCPFRKFHPQEI